MNRTLFDQWNDRMKAQWLKAFPKGAPTTHANCRKVFNCNRPGKTARDRAPLRTEVS